MYIKKTDLKNILVFALPHIFKQMEKKYVNIIKKCLIINYMQTVKIIEFSLLKKNYILIQIQVYSQYIVYIQYL